MIAIDWILKEWAIAVEALLTGDLLLLIRKGGIREAQPYFEVPSDRALLFPTYEHQSRAAIRPAYVDRFIERSVPKAGDILLLKGWAEITHQLPLGGDRLVETLHPFHIWTDDWLRSRLAWQPNRPTFALLLRVHAFTQPFPLTYQNCYGGCRSWIQLEARDALPASTPVLPSAAYDARVAAIRAAIAPVTAASVSEQ